MGHLTWPGSSNAAAQRDFYEIERTQGPSREIGRRKRKTDGCPQIYRFDAFGSDARPLTVRLRPLGLCEFPG